jgi:hypothetical protein
MTLPAKVSKGGEPDEAHEYSEAADRCERHTEEEAGHNDDEQTPQATKSGVLNDGQFAQHVS